LLPPESLPSALLLLGTRGPAPPVLLLRLLPAESMPNSNEPLIAAARSCSSFCAASLKLLPLALLL
jgi:hypothetical protein